MSSHSQLTPSHKMQLSANTTYTNHLTHSLIITCSYSRMATEAGRDLGGFWFGAQHHLTHTRARARTAPAPSPSPNRTEPNRTEPK